MKEERKAEWGQLKCVLHLPSSCLLPPVSLKFASVTTANLERETRTIVSFLVTKDENKPIVWDKYFLYQIK